MTQDQVVRAWKDPMFRSTLDQAAIPASPAGMVELSENEVTDLTGGTSIPCSIMFAGILLLNSCS